MYIYVYITTKDGSLGAWQAVNKSKDIEINVYIYVYMVSSNTMSDKCKYKNM